MSEAVTIEAAPTGGDVDAVGRQLQDAFREMKAAVGDGRAVTVIVPDADLLGQADPCDAALATALLGMVRTLAVEGVKPGWQVNMVATRPGHEAQLGPIVEHLLAIPGLSGQLIRQGHEGIGKVRP